MTRQSCKGRQAAALPNEKGTPADGRTGQSMALGKQAFCVPGLLARGFPDRVTAVPRQQQEPGGASFAIRIVLVGSKQPEDFRFVGTLEAGPGAVRQINEFGGPIAIGSEP